MENTLWEPKNYHYQDSNIAQFISYINKTFNQNITNYETLYDWSISDISSFWESVLNFCDVSYSSNYNSVINNSSSMLDSSWFDGFKFNFAENLLRFKDDRIAIEYFCENKIKGQITYKQLFESVRTCSLYLKSLNNLSLV